MDSECPSCQYPISDEYLARKADETADGDSADEATAIPCPNCGASLMSFDQDTLSLHNDALSGHARRFAHFQLLKILGQGGFGTVWLADDLRLERKVALKLPVRKRRDVSNLMREAKTAAKLRHPNIVSIHEVGEHENQLFIVCEYIEGMDLLALLREGPLPEHRVIELLRAIALGLQHAHENQVVHRDMKPANVLVDQSGTPLVTDFGLAKLTDVEESISSKGKVVGSILYMAPEQAGTDPDNIDGRADIYAIGVMMYEMLTGERPFRGSAHAIMHQKMSEEPAPLRSLRPSVALDLETICLKCLQRSPARRYETATELIDELDRYAKGKPILARPVSKLEYAWRWCNRNRMVASLLTLLFLSLSIGLAGTTFYWLQARDYWLRAKTETEKTRRSLYASQMVLASDFLGNGEIEATRLVLDRFRAPELQHFRGFEWHYMAHKMGRFKQFAHHGNGIADIAISRDGNWFASIANDRALRIWDSQSGTQIREIPFEIGRWQAIAISRRNNLVAAGAKDGSVHLWKTIQEPTLPAKVIKHGRGVTIVKFSSDGKRLFSASDEGAIRVWDTSNFELLKAIPTGKAGLVDFAVSKDGTIVVMAGREGVMRAWQDNVDEYTKICEIPDGRRVESVAVSSRGERFVAGTFHGELMAYETAGGRKLFEQATPYDWMSQIEFLAASSIVAICSSAGTIAFFDVDRQRELESFATHDRAGGLFAVSTNAKSMVVGSATGAIRLLDISDYQQSNSIINDMPVRDARILADDVVIAAYKDGSVRRLDYRQKSFQLLKEPSEMQTRPAICASPETSLIAIAQQDGSIELLDSDGESIETIPKHYGAPIALRLSSPADLLVVTGQTGPIVGYDIQRNRDPVAFEKFSIATGSTANVRDVCISHDQRRIAVALSDNSVRFYDIVNGKWLAETLSLESTPVSISFAHGDLVVGTRDAFLRRFDGQALHEIWRTKAHIGHLNMIAVIPGGNAVATVGGDRELRIWDLDNGDLRVRLYGHVHQVFSVDASTAGRTLVTGGVQGKVRIWRSKPMH